MMDSQPAVLNGVLLRADGTSMPVTLWVIQDSHYRVVDRDGKTVEPLEGDAIRVEIGGKPRTVSARDWTDE